MLAIRFMMCCVVWCCAVSVAAAHALKASVSVLETELVVTVRFDGVDEVTELITVRLEEADTQVLVAEGVIDKTGQCRLPRPKPGKYRVIAEDDGFGHRAERKVTVEESGTTEEAAPTTPAADRGLQVVIGLVVIGLGTLLVYWWYSRKQPTVAGA